MRCITAQMRRWAKSKARPSQAKSNQLIKSPMKKMTSVRFRIFLPTCGDHLKLNFLSDR